MAKRRLDLPYLTLEKYMNSNERELSGVQLLREHVDSANSERIVSKTANIESNTGKASLAMAMGALRVAKPVSVPLYHSGFRVTLAPILGVNKLILLDAMFDEVNSGNIDTLSLVNSACDGMLANVIIEAFTSNIISSTLDVSLQDIINYIDFRDMEAIKNGVLSAMSGSSIDLVTRCQHCDKEHVIDDYNLNDCTYANTDKLIGVVIEDNNGLEEEVEKDVNVYPKMFYSKSVSLEDLVEFKKISDFEASFEVTPELIIHCTNASVTSYIEDSKIWLNSVITAVNNAIISEDVPDSAIVKTKRKIMTLSLLSAYLPYVDSIEVVGRKTKMITDRIDILNILNSIIELAEYNEKIIEFFNDLIKDKTIAYVGITEFTCDNPECQKPNGDNDIIPINASQLFLEVCTLIREGILEKMQK